MTFNHRDWLGRGRTAQRVVLLLLVVLIVALRASNMRDTLLLLVLILLAVHLEFRDFIIGRILRSGRPRKPRGPDAIQPEPQPGN